MPSGAEEFLHGVEQEARRLPRDTRNALIEEVRAHLDASIHARMELGATLAEAEAQAVCALGNPVKLAREVSRVHVNRNVDRPFLLACLGVFVELALAQGGFPIPWLSWALLTNIAVLLYLAYRAQRFQWRALLLIFPIASLWCAISSAYTCYAPDNPSAPWISYAGITQELLALDAKAKTYTSRADKADQLYARFVAGENVGPAFSREATFASRELASQMWQQFGPGGEAERRKSFAYREQAAQLAAVDHTQWWKGLPKHMVFVQALVLPWMLVIAGISALGTFLFLAISALRSRWLKSYSNNR
ncbi:MAG: permease prefix domain 1-containing protein [Fimbriimonas sp.]